MGQLRILNVEAGLPDLEQARKLVAEALRQARRERLLALKVIHGYGSSGRGGKLRVGLRKSFRLRQKEGLLKCFICGEDFSIFNAESLALLQALPDLRGDPDLDAGNEGVTYLWLK